MDATIDTLELQLKATNGNAKKSINELITMLGKLDGISLASLRGDIQKTAQSFTDLDRAIRTINVGSLKEISNSFRSMAKSTVNFSSAVNNLSFTKAESDAKGFKSAIDEVTSDLTKQFGINKDDVDGLRERIVTLAKSVNELSIAPAGDDTYLQSLVNAQEELRHFLNTHKNVYAMSKEQYKDFVNFVRSSSVNTSEVAKEFSDSMYRDIRNAVDAGKGNWKIDAPAMDFSKWLESEEVVRGGYQAILRDAMVANGELSRGQNVTDNLAGAFRTLGQICSENASIQRSNAVAMNEVNSTAEGMSSAVSGATSAFDRLTVAEGHVASIGQTEAVNALHSMADGLRQFEGIRLTNVGQISELSNAIRSLGYGTSTKALQNIPILTRELNNLFHTLAQAPAISSNVTGLLHAITNFNNSLKGMSSSMRNAAGGAQSFNAVLPSLNSNLRNTHHTVRGLAGQLGKFWATFYLFIRGFQQIGKAIDLSSQLTEVENVVNQTFGGMRTMLDDFVGDSIQKFGMSELAVKQYASRFQAMGTSLGITGGMLQKTSSILGDSAEQYGKNTKSIAEMSLNLTKLTADMASFYDVEQDAVAEDLYSVFTGQTRSLRQYGIDLTQANLKEWALKQGIDANIASMTQAQKAALRYAYTLDAARYAMGDFTRTADTWHNQVNILKANLQQLAILIGTGFINVLKPFVTAFNNAMASVLKAVTAVLNALGKIFGWKYEVNLGGITTDMEDAAGYADDTASGLGDAAKNAKKLKNQLMSFDKLNVITTPTDSKGKGSGSGAGGGGAKVDNSDLISKVKTGEGLFDSDINDFYELGKKIGEKLRKMLKDIDWDKVFKAADNFGRDLAFFLNGLITPETFAMIGSTAANVLNTVLHGLDSFGRHFNWDNFGRSLAAGINAFFKTFDFELLADGINVWANGLLDALIAALENIEWRKIGNRIGDFLAAIDFKTILKKVGKAIWLAINGAFELYKGMFEKAPLETALLTLAGVVKLLKIPAVKNFTTALKGAYKVADTFTTSLSGGATVAASLTNSGFPKLGSAVGTVGTAFKQFTNYMRNGIGFSGSFSRSLETIRSAMSPLAKAITGVVGGLAEFALVSDGVKDLTKAINGGENSLVMALGEIAGGVAIGAGALTLAFGVPAGVVAAAIIGVVGLIKGINDAFDEIETKNYESSVVNALTKPGGQDVETMIEGTKSKIISVGDSFEDVSEKSKALEAAKDNVENVTQEIDKIQSSMDAGVISVEEGSEKLNAKFEELAKVITEKLGAAVDVIVAGFGENSAIAKAYEAAGTNVDQLKEDTIKAAAEMEEEAAHLVEQLASVPYGTDEWYEIKNRLIDMGQGMDTTTAAAENLKTQTAAGLDWSNFVDTENGLVAFEDIKESLDTVWAAADDVSDAFTEDTEMMIEAMIEAGNGEGAEALRNGLPDALSEMNKSNAEEIQKTTDALQEDLVNNISNIMSDAEEEWNNMSTFEKLFHPDGLDGYIKERVEAYKTDYIDPLSDEVETNLGQLGIDGGGWAKDAAQDIIDGLFEVDNPNSTTAYATLSSDWAGVIDDVEKDAVKRAKEGGKNVVGGLNEGAENEAKSSNTQTKFNSVFDAIWKSLQIAFDMHSPAKKMNPAGENIILGIFDGFDLVDFGAKMTEWWDNNVAPWFTLEKWSELGTNIKEGINAKWNEFVASWQESGVSSWWENDVSPWFELEKWEELVSSISESIKNKWGEASKQWKTNLKTWWEKDVSPWFTLKKWQDLFDNIKKAMKGKFEDGAKGAVGALNGLISGAENAVNKIVDALNTIKIPAWVPVFGGQGLNFSHVSLGRISFTPFENGGFPTIGSVFVAGEAGAEMVGNINGKTGVASGREITGIRDAIEDTSYREMDMMRRAISLLEGIYAKEFSVSADDVASATRDVADSYFNRTGRPYFAT